MMTIIIASVTALLILIGVSSNLFLPKDNSVEEACEEGIKDITGKEVDLSDWTPSENPNGMPGPVTPSQQTQGETQTVTGPKLSHSDGCNGPSVKDAGAASNSQNGIDPRSFV